MHETPTHTAHVIGITGLWHSLAFIFVYVAFASFAVILPIMELQKTHVCALFSDCVL